MSSSPWAATYPVWGWGGLADVPSEESLAALAPAVEAATGVAAREPERPGPLRLPPDRVSGSLPPRLAALASADPTDRARHGLGRAYRDLVRGLRGRLDDVPDVVVRPEHADDVEAVLGWASTGGAAVVPFGGGTSVVGGVEPRGLRETHAAVVSLDLCRLSGVDEVDPLSRAAHVRAGTSGPALEEALAPHGLTARFYPQSFERSTVGGWVATRAGGHFATGSTHVDDLVEAVDAVTPAGRWSSRRLPASGAGPSPDQLQLGGEGALGVVTGAWLRVQPRPVARWAGLAAADDLAAGAAAVRAVLQAGLRPATCRVLDAGEAALTGTLRDGRAAVVLGLESLGPPLDAQTGALLEVVRNHGCEVLESGARGGGGGAWRSAFLRAPYLRDSLVVLGVLVETFETAVTWERLDGLVAAVLGRTRSAVREVCGAGTVTVRLTHCYPDGAAPYFTVFAPAPRGAEVEAWDEVKAAATAAVLDAGGTVTHHHAVGRDHRPGYDRQRPDAFARALRGAKDAVDPAGVLNPGVLVG